jgi:hypothetical protein
MKRFNGYSKTIAYYNVRSYRSKRKEKKFACPLIFNLTPIPSPRERGFYFPKTE